MSELAGHTGLAFVGCYTKGEGGDGAGILAVRRDGSTLRPLPALAPTPSPSFLTFHPTHAVLYAVNELTEGGLSAFDVAPDGGLTPRGSWPTGGSLPCHVLATPTSVFVANYGDGSVVVFPLDDRGVPTGASERFAHSGQGPHPQRQTGPHAHMVTMLEDNLLAVDLGIDAVIAYPMTPAGVGPGIPVLAATPGSGPRHLVQAPNGLLHVVGELSVTVASYESSAEGWSQVAEVPACADPESLPSEIALSQDGRFLYVGNRGPDTIAVFSLADGLPRMITEVSCEGAWPRHFVIVDGLMYVANERSDAVVTFRLDPETGLPTPTGEVLSTPSPTCVLP